MGESVDRHDFDSSSRNGTAGIGTLTDDAGQIDAVDRTRNAVGCAMTGE
jgi:hypothetical protein